MAYGDFKYLPRIASDKELPDKAFNIDKNPKYDRYQCANASIVYNFFNRKSSGAKTSSGAIKSETITNQELAESLRKPIVEKFEICKVYSSFKDNMFGKGIRFLLCVIDVYGKYAWVVFF